LYVSADENGLRLFKGAVCLLVLFNIYLSNALCGRKDDVLFNRKNHVPPNWDTAGENLRQNEEA